MKAQVVLLMSKKIRTILQISPVHNPILLGNALFYFMFFLFIFIHFNYDFTSSGCRLLFEGHDDLIDGFTIFLPLRG